jgi:hypothetical protein
MTTIPSRFEHIHISIDSLLNQTIKPEKIIINIPKKYNFRFDNEIPIEKINKLKEKYSNSNVFVNIIDFDYGPGTKLLGLFNIINMEKKDTYIILIDDDLKYNQNMIEYFDDIVKSNSEKIIDVASYCVYNYKDIYIGQGSDGLFINQNSLINFLDYYNKIKDCDYINYHDDFYISYYFYITNKKVYLIYQPYNKSVYQRCLSSELDSLINITGKYARENLIETIYNILQGLRIDLKYS